MVRGCREDGQSLKREWIEVACKTLSPLQVGGEIERYLEFGLVLFEWNEGVGYLLKQKDLIAAVLQTKLIIYYGGLPSVALYFIIAKDLEFHVWPVY